MDFKKDIETLLNTLQVQGWGRAEIEQELNYSENYIDQVLSKGGNKRFLGALTKFAEKVLQKATPISSSFSKKLEGPTSATLQDYIELLQQNDKFLKETLTKLTSNLTALVTMVSAGHRTELVYHDVMLQSLARLERKPQDSLIATARNNDILEQAKELGKDIHSKKST